MKSISFFLLIIYPLTQSCSDFKNMYLHISFCCQDRISQDSSKYMNVNYLWLNLCSFLVTFVSKMAQILRQRRMVLIIESCRKRDFEIEDVLGWGGASITPQYQLTRAVLQVGPCRFEVETYSLSLPRCHLQARTGKFCLYLDLFYV